jgi:hypothetical protein
VQPFGLMTARLRTILGSDLGGYWDARALVGLVGGAVDTWEDQLTRALGRRWVAAAPAARASLGSLSGGPAVICDGVDDELRMAAAPSIAGGSAPYWFVAGAFQSLVATARFLVASGVLPASSTFCQMGVGAAGSVYNQTRGDSSGALNVSSGVNPGTSVHLFEAGLTAGGVASVVIDGVGTSTVLNGTSGVWDDMAIGANGGAQFAAFSFLAIVFCVAEPSAAKRTAVRALMKGPQPGYTSSSYGLP